MDTFLIICLFLPLIVFIYLAILVKRKNIALQNELEETKGDLVKIKIKLFNEITDRENQNSHISKEIHDQIGSSLTAIKMSVIHMNIDDDDRKRLNESIRDLSIDIRRISNDLIPSILEMLGFQKAILDFCNRMNERTKIKFNYHALSQQEEIHFDKNTQIALYRIMEDLCYCMIQNSNADRITLYEKMKDGIYHLHLECDDANFNLRETLELPKNNVILNKIDSRLHMIPGKINFNLHSGKTNTTQIELISNGKN